MAFCFCILEIRWFYLFIFVFFPIKRAAPIVPSAERTLYLHVINQMWNSYDGTNQNDDDKSDGQQRIKKNNMCKRTTNLSFGIVYLFLLSAANYKWNNLVSDPRAHMRYAIHWNATLLLLSAWITFYPVPAPLQTCMIFRLFVFMCVFFPVVWCASVGVNIWWTNRH